MHHRSCSSLRGLSKKTASRQTVSPTGMHKRTCTSLRELPQTSTSWEEEIPSKKRGGTNHESNDSCASSELLQQIQPTQESAGSQTTKKSQQQTKERQRMEEHTSSSELDERKADVVRTSNRRYLRGIPRELNPPAMFWFNAHQCAKCGMSFPIKQTMWKHIFSEHKREIT